MRSPHPRFVLGVNLVLGSALLIWVLDRFGRPAFELLAAEPSPPRLVMFGLAAAAIVCALSWRWRIVLAGLDAAPPLRPLVLFRLAGQSLSSLVPSAKIGGDPLRAWLTARSLVPPEHAFASVAIDRALETGAAATFSVIFATVLVERGIPELREALVAVSIVMAALAVGIWVTVRRLRRGAGLATALARGSRLDRLRVVQQHMGVIAASDAAAADLVGQPRRMAGAFLVGVAANLLVLVEYYILLTAFGLPSTVVAVVAANFATAAAHLFPVPAGVGVIEGGQMWLFGVLGYPPEVGLAVGLVVRLRELVWLLPGTLYLLGRGLGGSFVGLRS